MSTESLVGSCRHTKLWHHWLYFLCWEDHIHMACLFYDQTFVSLNPLRLFAPPAPPPSPLLAISSFSVSVSVFLFRFYLFVLVLGSTYMWNNTLFGFLWLISLSIIPSRSMHVVAKGKISFFLWLSHIHVCMCVCECVCVCVSDILTHSSIDRHLGCFHSSALLAVVHNALTIAV